MVALRKSDRGGSRTRADGVPGRLTRNGDEDREKVESIFLPSHSCSRTTETITPKVHSSPSLTVSEPAHLRKLRETFASLACGFGGFGLASKLRELVILHTAWQAQSEHVWTQHDAIASAVGVTGAQKASIQQGQIQSFAFDAREQELLRFVSRLLAQPELTWSDLPQIREHFDETEIIEILALHGFYHSVSLLMTLLNRE
jgi:alkylhydroperoxidase family enzyme